MAEVTSGDLTVMILSEREASNLRKLLYLWNEDYPTGQRQYPHLYAVMEALGVFDTEVI